MFFLKTLLACIQVCVWKKSHFSSILEEGTPLDNINKSSQFHCLHDSEESSPWTKVFCSFCSYLSLMIQTLAFQRVVIHLFIFSHTFFSVYTYYCILTKPNFYFIPLLTIWAYFSKVQMQSDYHVSNMTPFTLFYKARKPYLTVFYQFSTGRIKFCSHKRFVVY